MLVKIPADLIEVVADPPQGNREVMDGFIVTDDFVAECQTVVCNQLPKIISKRKPGSLCIFGNNSMKSGTQKIPTSGLLGYDKDEDGNMVIVAQEAEIVRTIYKSFVQGVHPSLIAIRLNGLGLKTVYGNDWSGNSVRNILRNEKYCGDVLMQKTITVDYLSHVSKPNEGEAEQYYIADHHDAIVSREM